MNQSNVRSSTPNQKQDSEYQMPKNIVTTNSFCNSMQATPNNVYMQSREVHESVQLVHKSNDALALTVKPKSKAR